MFNIGKVILSDEAKDHDQNLIKELVEGCHQRGNFGDICIKQSDKNRAAIYENENVLSRYETDDGTFMVLTVNDRSFTTVFVEGEYG